MQLSPKTTETLLERYRITLPVNDKRFAAHADLTRGTRIDIRCELDPVWGKRLIVRCDRAQFSRSCPLQRADADILVEALHAAGLLPDQFQERTTFGHLLERCSDLYVTEALDMLELTVYLRENGYRVTRAGMEHSGPLHAKPRLKPDAHDKDAVFAHRPTARRKHAPTTDAEA